MERRLREAMTGKAAAELEASKSSVLAGDVQEHADHVTHWRQPAIAYLASALDGGSLGLSSSSWTSLTRR